MIGNRNDLSVWKMGYLPWRFRNIFHNIKTFFRNIRRAWQRACYGFCDADVWDLNSYLSVLLRETLYYLSENNHGYPALGLYADDELWKRDLRRIAEAAHYLMLDHCENEYYDKYFEANHSDNSTISESEMMALLKRAQRQDEENQRKVTDARVLVSDWLMENFDDLWD